MRSHVGQLSKIGIEGTIKVVDRAPWFESMRKGDYYLSVRSESERLDPDDAYYLVPSFRRDRQE